MANTDVTTRDTQLEKQRLGYMSLSLTNFGNTSEPAIAGGSVVEVGGTLYSFTSDESITNWSSVGNNTDAYIKLVPGSGSVTAQFTTTVPAWDATKQGWYDGSDRYIGGLHRGASSADYEGKYLYSQMNANNTGVLVHGDGSVTLAGGNASVDAQGHGNFPKVNTGHGDNELYPMNQGVRSTDDVTYETITVNNELKSGSSTEGIWTVGGNSTMTIPAGVYHMEPIGINVWFEYKHSSSGGSYPGWIAYGGSGSSASVQDGALVFSDGSNYRINNTSSVSKDVYYRRVG